MDGPPVIGLAATLPPPAASRRRSAGCGPTCSGVASTRRSRSSWWWSCRSLAGRPDPVGVRRGALGRHHRQPAAVPRRALPGRGGGASVAVPVLLSLLAGALGRGLRARGRGRWRSGSRPASSRSRSSCWWQGPTSWPWPRSPVAGSPRSPSSCWPRRRPAPRRWLLIAWLAVGAAHAPAAARRPGTTLLPIVDTNEWGGLLLTLSSPRSASRSRSRSASRSPSGGAAACRPSAS